jgi:hypothetical protein
MANKPSQPQKVHCFTCKHVGLSFVTDLWGLRREDGKYELRQGFALFGHLMDEKSTDGNPFDKNFRDNFVQGEGNDPMVSLRLPISVVVSGLDFGTSPSLSIQSQRSSVISVHSF